MRILGPGVRLAWWGLGATAVISLVCGVGCVTDGQTRSPGLTEGASSATIKVSCGGPGELVLRDPRTRAVRKLESADSVFRLPAGSYELLGYVSSVRDEGGRHWRGMTSLSSGGPTAVRLRDRHEETVTAGAPYEARVAVRKGARRAVSLDFTLRDSGGRSCQITAGGGRSAKPAFSVKDGDGRVVLTGTFEYG